jgi:glutathione S-transferase
MRLITIPISHFCEKARWALDRAGIAYTEERHVQGLHRIACRRAGGGRTAPVLVLEDRVLAESAEIVAHALGEPDERARALERDFDQRLGPAGRLWMYWSLHDRRDIAVAYNCTGVPAWERRVFPLAYPLAIRYIDRQLGVSDGAAAQSRDVVDATFDGVAERLADGRPYLLGEEFTTADLAFAALAAAVLMPDGYGVPLPQPEELPDEMASAVRAWREHPAGRHALLMFERERR